MSVEGQRAPRPTLRYDSDCPFCTASARWLESRTGGRILLEATPGIPAAELEDERGARRSGGAAVTGALALGAGPRWLRVLARLLDLPGVRVVRDLAYGAAAHLRWVVSRLAGP